MKLQWKKEPSAPKGRFLPSITPSLASLVVGMLLLPACGEVNIETSRNKEMKSKLMGDVRTELMAELGIGEMTQEPVVSDSSCVTCHTDKEKLKFETASIKKPSKSALQSGKG